MALALKGALREEEFISKKQRENGMDEVGYTANSKDNVSFFLVLRILEMLQSSLARKIRFTSSATSQLLCPQQIKGSILTAWLLESLQDLHTC
jgi:hypothetical protein